MKDKTRAFFDGLGRFFQSDWMILIDATCVIVGWSFNIWVYMLAALAVLNIAPLFFCKETKHLLALLMMFSLIISADRHNLKEFAPLLAIVAALFAGILFNLIFFRRKFNALAPKRIKSFHFALILLVIPAALGGVGSPYDHPLAVLAAVALFLVVALGYTFFVVTNSDSCQRRDIADYVLKTLFAMGLIILAQSAIHFSTYGNMSAVIDAMAAKKLQLGWAGPNNVAPTLSMCIPATLYFCIRKNKLTPVFTVIALIEYAALFTTGCRGAILFTTMALPAMLLYVAIKSENKPAFCITLCLFFCVAVFVIALYGKSVAHILEVILNKGLDSAGRTKYLYPEAIDAFKQWPIFGAGWDFKLGELAKDGYSPYWFHSTALQVLAMMGVVGVVFYVLFYFARYRTFLSDRKNPAAIALLAGVALFDAYGMVDTNFFGPTFFIMLTVMTFAVEIGLDDDRCRMFANPFKRKKAEAVACDEAYSPCDDKIFFPNADTTPPAPVDETAGKQETRHLIDDDFD